MIFFVNQAWTAGLKVLIYVQAAFLTESKESKGPNPGQVRPYKKG